MYGDFDNLKNYDVDPRGKVGREGERKGKSKKERIRTRKTPKD